MGTRSEELKNGCLARAKDDEPLFVLMARDSHAPMLIRDWAFRRQDDVAKGHRPKSDTAVVAEAFSCADRMEKWNHSYREGLAAQAKLDLEAKGGVKV